MNGKLVPVAKAMVLCDDIRPNINRRGKVDLIGVGFHVIRSSSDPPFPYRHRQLCAFLQLTDAQGEGIGRIMVREANSDRVIHATQEYRILFPNRLHLISVSFRMRSCTFPRPELYWIEFHFDGERVAFQPVHLIR